MEISRCTYEDGYIKVEISRCKYEDLGEGKVSETFSAWPASTSTVSVNLKIILKIIVKIIVKMV